MGGVCWADCGQSRAGLTEKLNASEPMEIKRAAIPPKLCDFCVVCSL